MKLCEFENCKKEASYAQYFMKPIYCKTHKKDNMKTKKYICVCGKSIPIFGLKTDTIASCCKECRTDVMIDLKHKKCKCNKARPSFGLENDKTPTCCKECRTDIMIDLVHNKCKCGKSIPTYGLIDDKRPTFCLDCKTDIMVDLAHKKCICKKARPSFGLKNDKIPICCKECRTDIMIDLVNINLQCSCGTRATFGLENDIKPSCCKICKTDIMINITNNRCKCDRAIPSFGLETDKIPTCCKECKTEEMINIRDKDKKCVCGRAIPCFGLETDKSATCCKECKTDIMINIKDKKCKCGAAIPSFGLETDTTAICCIRCKTTEMSSMSNKKCKSNYLENGKKFECTTTGNKKYKGYCTRCYAFHFPNDPLTFQIRCKTKEIAVRDYINSTFEGFHHDIPLWIGACECTQRRRIDHRKLINNTLLCIETDENQHKASAYTDKGKEERYSDVMMFHGGKFIFIRFNPDKYKEKGINKNPNISTRLLQLEAEVKKQIKRIENEENKELFEEIYMFYDTK